MDTNRPPAVPKPTIRVYPKRVNDVGGIANDQEVILIFRHSVLNVPDQGEIGTDLELTAGVAMSWKTAATLYAMIGQMIEQRQAAAPTETGGRPN